MINEPVLTGLGAAVRELYDGASVLRERFNLNDQADDYEALARLLTIIQNDQSIEPGDPRYTPDPFEPAMNYVYRFLMEPKAKLSKEKSEAYKETAMQLDAWQTGVKKK